MADPQTTAFREEIEELRREIRGLREEQERQKQKNNGNGDHGQQQESGVGGEEKDNEGDKEKEEEKDKKPHPLRKVFVVVAVVVLGAIGVLWWLHARQFETTDDAIVDGHTSGVSTRIAGTVTKVLVEENQPVKVGDLVTELDPRDYEISLKQIRSQLQQAVAQTQAEQPNVPVTVVTNQTNISTADLTVSGAEDAIAAAERNYEGALARVREAEANNEKAQADVERYRPLAQKDEVPRQQFDQVVANAKALEAAVVASKASAEAARKQVDQSRTQLAQARHRSTEAQQIAPRQVAIRQANVVTREATAQVVRAQVEQAQLNLSYCRIFAPVAGVVVRRTAEVGQHVAPGQQVLSIAQIDDLWVTANYKETQIRRMQQGQSVRIHVDALGSEFDGYVESMPAASGAMTSLLPPENATGNFVKVVQRLPVRIRFRKDQTGLDRLRPGMSVEPKTRVL